MWGWIQLCIIITWAKKILVWTQEVHFHCVLSPFIDKGYEMISIYMKKSCSCHLFSWSWQAKVNEKYFLLKTLKDWMDSTRRLLQSWKRSGFLTNICLFLFLLVLQNSMCTSFCIIDLLPFFIIFILLTGSQLAWRTWIRTAKNPVGNRRFH